MKATIDIPEALYRSVKARASLEGQTVREVTISLFNAWMVVPAEAPATAASKSETTDTPHWFGLARRFADPANRHDMSSVRRSIEAGLRRVQGQS